MAALMSDQKTKEALDALLREGAVSYLDALAALQRFQRAVSDAATVVLKRRLPELVSAVGISGPKSGDVARFCKPDYASPDRDDNWAWIASGVWFPEPWGQFSYLGLSFSREVTADESSPYVTFTATFKRAGDYAKVKSEFRDRGREEHYYDVDQDYECGFMWELDKPLEMESEFTKMIDYAIEIWKQVGGWSHLKN